MRQRKCFYDTKQKHVCWETFCQKGFWLHCGTILLSMSNELNFIKWVRFFERNCIVKWMILIASFCWLWDFLLEKMKLKWNSDDVRWNVWTNIKKLYPQNIIFKTRIPNMAFSIIYILVQISLLGTALGHFKFFCRRSTMVVDIFTQPPTIEKLLMALN